MSALEEILKSSRRNFIIIAHRARSDDRIKLNDLCGASGRWDGILRCITSALFLSHDMRRDTSVHVLLLGPGDPPKLLTVNGKTVRHLNPDERASAALIRKCLSRSLPGESGSFITPSPGISLTRCGLDELLGSISGTLIMLDERGVRELPEGVEEPVSFILSDDMDLTTGEAELIRKRTDRIISVGPKVLHSNMAIIIVHNMLDIREYNQSHMSDILMNPDVVSNPWYDRPHEGSPRSF